jgi:hypothetical protein
MRRSLTGLLIAAVVAYGATLAAQLSFPEIPFDAVDPLTYPPNIHQGEVAGVATNSKGEIYVYTRTGTPYVTIGGSRAVSHGGSRLFQFDASGKFVREIGQGIYGFLYAQQVRVDAQDNVWIVDQMSNQVVKFNPAGRVQMVIGRKPEAMRIPALPAPAPPAPAAGRGAPPPAAPGAPGAPAAAASPAAPGGGGRGGGLPGAGAAGEQFNRPTDVAWDAAGNIYVADGYGNSRVAKYDQNGKWIKNWGSTGTAPGQFTTLHGIAIDAKGMVYVADRGNRRIQVFDADGNFKAQYQNAGTPWAVCISPGAHQYLYVSNSNPPDSLDYDGEILKMELDGRIVGRFGKVGKQLKEFGTVNAIDCRSENQLYVGEVGNWRVQKLTLRPAASRAQ